MKYIFLINKNKEDTDLTRDVFPKSINGSDLNYGSNNENLKITVNMSFRYWTPLDINEEH